MVCLEHAANPLQSVVEPLPMPDILYTLQECRKSRDLDHGRHIHVQLCQYGLEAHASIGNHLVPMLSECGGFQDARNAFNRLTYRNEHTWTSLIQSYLNCGEPELALSLYSKMQEDRVYPNEYTFVPLLKSCCRLRCDTRGKELHSEIICRGFEYDIILGNTLLDTYVKCCTIMEARAVFDHLPHQDVVSWNTLIAGYAEQGLSEEAHSLYKQMVLEGLLPDACTFVCILNACGKGRAIHIGRAIHAEVVKEGYEECTSVAYKLVYLYAQCGLLEEAQVVFDELPIKDVIAWTALIAGYAEYGSPEKALSCYQQMQLEGVNPDAVTLVCALKACDSTGDIDKGLEIHSQIVKQEGTCDPFIGNTLVCMYARCGWLLDSKIEFDKLQDRDVVTWTGLIAGYAECRLGKEALETFERMLLEGVSPNAITLTCIMQVCCNEGTIHKGQRIHDEIVKRGFETDTAVCNIVINLYMKFCLLEEAQVVFDTCGTEDVSSWNALIAGYAEHGHGDKILACLECMQMDDLSPSAETYSYCLNCCASARSMNMGLFFHVEVLKKGLERELNVGSALMELYAKCGSLAELDDLFCKLPERDVVMWNMRIQGYVEYGLCEEALSLLEQMYVEGVLPDIAVWNRIILGFVELGQSVKGLELYAQMQAQGLSPDGVMLRSILKACGELAALELGKRVHAQSCQIDQLESIELCNTLIDMYGKCGSMRLAQEIFDSKASTSLVRWNTLLAGYARHGASELVFHYFDKMREQGIHPDEITFLSVLTAYSHAGSLIRGQKFFEAMIMECGLCPTVKHYTCMIDHYGRAGHVDEVMAMVAKMPSNSDPVLWNMVLGSCQKLADPNVGRQAFDSLVTLDENHPAAFILLSNIYANANSCKDSKNPSSQLPKP
eukprot:c20327_g1_i1 orf=679-3360(+)